jgi:hypothetical protein
MNSKRNQAPSQGDHSTSTTLSPTEDQRYRRWWERRFEQKEPTSLFELMYEDLDLVSKIIKTAAM